MSDSKHHPKPTGRRYRTVRELIAEKGVPEEVAKEFKNLEAAADEGLDDLLKRITPENQHTEINSGPSVGDEVW